MHHKVRRCRACGNVIHSGDAKCSSCHSDLKKRKTSYLGRKKKELMIFFDRLLNVRIKTK